MKEKSSGCIVWSLALASIALSAALLTGCIASPYANALKKLAGETEPDTLFLNPFTAGAEADRLSEIVEKKLRSGEKSDETALKKYYNEGEEAGRSAMRVECIEKLSRIAKSEVDVVGGEDLLDKTIGAIAERIETLEKNQVEDAARPRRIMRDVASKLGVSVNEKMNLDDLHSRIVGVIQAEANVPKLIPENEIEDALKETTWKTEFGEYHQFLKELNGKRVIVIPASR